ncbi:hypothetical protein DDQ41_08025 [Streptomyces spongiicola]|uniref:Uncharacterized protein n=1 Tax=Streptomyces spongiicola TaxID=1690221 RepID=A0ABM6V5C2_9ACTN|nr:hypothetical protein DDQ41_08025 [Streptomyces spongiicola]
MPDRACVRRAGPTLPPTADCRLPTADCRLPTADCRRPCLLPTVGRRSSVAGRRSRVAGRRASGCAGELAGSPCRVPSRGGGDRLPRPPCPVRARQVPHGGPAAAGCRWGTASFC